MESSELEGGASAASAIVIEKDTFYGTSSKNSGRSLVVSYIGADKSLTSTSPATILLGAVGSLKQIVRPYSKGSLLL